MCRFCSFSRSALALTLAPVRVLALACAHAFVFSPSRILSAVYNHADPLPCENGMCEIKKYQIVESQSTQVRQRYMKCDTQLLYGTSGPTRVNEDGSCRASDTCALQGYVQRCLRSTLCSGDRHTRETNNKVTKVTEDTKSGFYTVQSLMSLSHDDSHAITSRQQGNLRLTHFQCSK